MAGYKKLDAMIETVQEEKSGEQEGGREGEFWTVVASDVTTQWCC